MNPKHFLLALAAATTIVLPALAHEFTIGELTINHPYIVATPKTAKTAAGYFSVTNAGAEPDQLIGIESDLSAMLHETTTDANGVAKMGDVEALSIAPGQTVTLAPRAMHVMFMGLTKPLLVGDKVPATLVFEKAGPVDVVFNVQSRADSTKGATEHGDMGHGGMNQGEMPGGAMSHDGMDHGAMPGMSN
jgi:copper(I)-binding protein